MTEADFRPLTEPVERAAARAHVQQLKQSGRLPADAAPVIAIVVIAIVVGVFVVFGIIAVGILTTALGALSGGSPLGGVFTIVPLLVIGLGIAGAVYAIVRAVRGSSGERVYRLDRFAQANGMRWFARADAPPLPGMLFGVGHSRRATDIVRGDRPRLVEFANYRYKTGSGKNETTHAWGYVAVRLAQPLPHIVLDATSNNSLFGSNLPASFDRGQRLSLEGDFDDHFALYCPAGYERDALYLFTPDIMARFIDSAAALDVEIVDDWLFLYAKRDFSTLDPATWAWLFSVVGALLGKLAQWERWRDDRLTGDAAGLPFAAPAGSLRPPVGVAPQGRRLARGIPWAAIVIVGGFVAFWLFSQLGVFAGLFGSLLR
ncbi:hypothetical protein [Microbacterium telephonicum]|uniref:Uncharacterized protein n=1 Tax=Microbacterium telephonicum TaxID=1714841 RepID=A0A498CFQ8_9MICO|nr:hypothetical protein [Microbacterium telephonicum]RLK52170.1 hypothetical protein C7474_0099 [Microbacterium telephonicum]